MRFSLRAALLVSTVLTFAPGAADAAPLALAFATSVAGSVLTAAVAGTAIVWSTALTTAAVAALGAGLSMVAAPKGGSTGAQEITLNKVQPVTEGLILYGERMLGGAITARSVSSAGGKTNGRYHSVMPLACHEIDGVSEVWIGEQKVWTDTQFALDEGGAGDAWSWGQIDSDYKGKFRLRIHTGSDDQVADARYVAAVSEWSIDARGRGIAFLYFEADFDADTYPQGPEAIRTRVRGKRIIDPRDAMVKFSSNPALIARDYALTPEERGGIGWGVDDINDAAIIALANVSDEIVPLDGGGSEARYAFNGVFDTAASPEENLRTLATSWGGWWTVDRGRLEVGGAAYEPPAFEITEDMIVGAIKVSARRPFEQQFNQVKAIYVDPEAEDTPTDLPVLKSAAYKAEDNGEDLVRDMGELLGEISFSRGQRLQKLALLKARRQKRVEIPCDLSAWGVRLGEVIEVTIPRRGWLKKTFEVERRVPTISRENVEVRLSLLETSAAIYDWTTSEETPKPAGGVSTLPSPFARPVVTAPASTEALYATRGGGGVKLRVTLSSSTLDPFVEEWQFAHRLTSEPGAEEVLGPKQSSPAIVLEDMKPGTYIFGARARNRRGMWGEWYFAAPEIVEGLNDVPVGLSGFSVQALGAIALAKWDRHPSLDVQQGGEIEFRHSADPGATWTTSTTIARSVQGLMTEAPLPLKAGVYLARVRDSQGIVSPPASFVVTRTGTDGLSLLLEIEEAPTFGGALVDVSVVGGEAKIDNGVSVGSIGFASLVDLGAISDVRLVSDMRARVANPDSAFGNIGVPFGSTDIFGNSGGAEGDVQLWVRATSSDPETATDWSPWQRLDVADFTARGFQVEARLIAEGEDYVVAVTGLKLKIYG